ncbi:hypothetical protein LINGRAHAP2_LOCUS27244 [Linum grandiflorum]
MSGRKSTKTAPPPPATNRTRDGSAETVATKTVNNRAAPNLAAKRPKVVASISSNVSKVSKSIGLSGRVSSSKASPMEIGSSSKASVTSLAPPKVSIAAPKQSAVAAPKKSVVAAPKQSAVAAPKQSVVAATKESVVAAPRVIGGTGRVSIPRACKEKVVEAPKVSGGGKVSAVKGCVESKVKASGTMEKKKENSAPLLQASKPPLRTSPASKPPSGTSPASKPPLRTSPRNSLASKGKEKMETPPRSPTTATTTTTTTKVEKLKLGGGGGTHQRDSKLKSVSKSEVKEQKQVGRQKVVEPSTKRLDRSTKPCVPEKKKPIEPAVDQGMTFYLKWDEQDLVEEQDSKLGQECLLCEKDLSYAPLPPEMDMGTYNFPEAAVLPCGHVFHTICLESAFAGAPGRSVEPTCFLCASFG